MPGVPGVHEDAVLSLRSVGFDMASATPKFPAALSVPVQSYARAHTRAVSSPL